MLEAPAQWSAHHPPHCRHPPARLQDGVAPLTVTAAGAAGGASKKGGKGGKPQAAAGGGLQLDDEWVVEHAVMLERLLPGGAPAGTLRLPTGRC